MLTPGPEPRRVRARRGAVRASCGVAALLLCGIALASPGAAVACGHCVEDKIAATYDYGVVTRAREAGHRVYYFAVVGRIRPGDPSVARDLSASLAGAPGVDAGTVRVSVDPAAVSFAAAPAAGAERRVARAVAERLRTRGLSLQFLSASDGMSEGAGGGRLSNAVPSPSMVRASRPRSR